MRRGCMECCLLFIFTITVSAQSITVNNPNGRSEWIVGSDYTIVWTASGAMHERVKIHLYNSTGTVKIREVARDTANDGSHPITVPQSFVPGFYVIRVIALDDTIHGDSEVFVVSPAVPWLEVVSPNGGECLRHGERKHIRWDTNQVSGLLWIKIYTGSMGDRRLGHIASGIPVSSGSYLWDVGKLVDSNLLVPAGSDYYIEIFSSAKEAIDTSDRAFSIREALSRPSLEKKPPETLVRSLPDFKARVLPFSNYNSTDRIVSFGVFNTGAPYSGDVEVKVECLEHPEWNNTVILGGLFDRNQRRFVSSKPFVWPHPTCYLNFIVTADPLNKLKELNEDRDNILIAKIFPTAAKHIMFDNQYLTIRSRNIDTAVYNGQTLQLRNPADVLVAEPEIILMDVFFSISGCSGKGYECYPRIIYYGADNVNRYHDLGRTWLAPGESKSLQYRIQLKIRRTGNYVAVTLQDGSIHPESILINFSFNARFFE